MSREDREYAAIVLLAGLSVLVVVVAVGVMRYHGGDLRMLIALAGIQCGILGMFVRLRR